MTDSSTVRTAFDMSSAFEDRVNAGDIDGLLSLLEPGAVSRTVQGETLTDTAGIRADLTGLLSGRPTLTNSPRLVLEAHGVALMLIDWTLEVDTPGGRAQLAGTTTNVVRRNAEGDWRLAVLNPMGTAGGVA